MDDLIQCPNCGELRSADLFTRRKTKRHWCRPCRDERQKQRQREWRQRKDAELKADPITAEQLRISQRDMMRAWRQTNADKYRAYQAAYHRTYRNGQTGK